MTVCIYVEWRVPIIPPRVTDKKNCWNDELRLQQLVWNELDGDEHTGTLESQDEMGIVSRAAEQISGLQSDRKPEQMKRERMLGFTSLIRITVSIWSDLISSDPHSVSQQGSFLRKAFQHALLTPAGLVGYFVPNKWIDSVLFKTDVSPAEPPYTLMDQTKWAELQGARHESPIPLL